MAKLGFRKGAGYSIEAILAAVILFTFAFGAVQSPEGSDWSRFQNELAVRDLTFMIKKTGDLNVFLRNSNTGGIRTEVSEISGRDLRVSGTVENLPLNEMRIGFHQMPSEIHVNGTEPVETGDRCYGDLVSLDANSEEPILRTVPSQELASRHQTYLYFGDTDARQPTGYNGEEDYDTVWVDNGTECVLTSSEGPYSLNDIFLWGNSSGDPDAKHYEFKNFDDADKEFTVYEAEKAYEVKKAMKKPLNGLETDTTVDTVNFSSGNLETYDVLVFQENETLSRISSNSGILRDIVSNTSMMFLMNLSRNDLQNNFLQDIGFRWTPMDLSGSDSYSATFSNYETSEDIESYFLGLSGRKDSVSLKPGGNVISGQAATETSRDDVLFARNVQYNADDLDGTASTWNPTGGPTTCGNDYQSDFTVPGPDYTPITVTVKNVDVSDSCSGPRGLMVDTDGDSDLDGPFLQDEIFRLNGRRYSPNINSNTDARLEFAGSRKVELVNHREVLENLEGKRAARISYEENYETMDTKIIASTLYWLRGDTVSFEATEEPSSLASTVIGGVNDKIFLPYRMDLRWSQ